MNDGFVYSQNQLKFQKSELLKISRIIPVGVNGGVYFEKLMDYYSLSLEIEKPIVGCSSDIENLENELKRMISIKKKNIKDLDQQVRGNYQTNEIKKCQNLHKIDYIGSNNIRKPQNANKHKNNVNIYVSNHSYQNTDSENDEDSMYPRDISNKYEATDNYYQENQNNSNTKICQYSIHQRKKLIEECLRLKMELSIDDPKKSIKVEELVNRAEQNKIKPKDWTEFISKELGIFQNNKIFL